MQPEFVRNNIDVMLEFMRGVVAQREAGTLRHGFMIGCGDSYCGARRPHVHDEGNRPLPGTGRGA